MGLTAKQRAFVNEYLKCRNATEAARRAGYAHPNTQGPRLLVNVGVQEEIEQRFKKNAMAADEVLSRLSDMARADLGPHMNADGEVDIASLKKAGLTHLINAIELNVTEYGGERKKVRAKVKTYSALDALQTLAKHHKLLTDKVEHHHSGSIGFTADEMATAQDELDAWTNGNGQK